MQNNDGVLSPHNLILGTELQAFSNRAMLLIISLYIPTVGSINVHEK